MVLSGMSSESRRKSLFSDGIGDLFIVEGRTVRQNVTMTTGVEGSPDTHERKINSGWKKIERAEEV